MAAGIQIVLDCADPDRLTRFWSTALGYVPQPPPPGYETWEDFAVAMEIPPEKWNDVGAAIDPDKARPRLLFLRVDEPKTVKNRMHLDVNVSGGPGTPMEERKRQVDAEVQRLKAAGASVLEPSPRGDGEREYWVTMADPEGNEFCVQ
jgi:hypothetical protein